MVFSLIGSESHFPLLDTNSLDRNDSKKINAAWVVMYLFFVARLLLARLHVQINIDGVIKSLKFISGVF